VRARAERVEISIKREASQSGESNNWKHRSCEEAGFSKMLLMAGRKSGARGGDFNWWACSCGTNLWEQFSNRKEKEVNSFI